MCFYSQVRSSRIPDSSVFGCVLSVFLAVYCSCVTVCVFADEQVKERCQKGIPPSLRGRAWLYLTGGKVKREQNQGRFQVGCMRSLFRSDEFDSSYRK